MPPTSKTLTGHIGFELCVPACIRSFVKNRGACRVLKFHIWIHHGKIADECCCFFSCLSYLPFWSYAPLKKSE